MSSYSSASASASAGGIGFCGLLTIAFIVLKLCKVITWDWIWVLSPLWIGFAAGLGILAVIGIVFLITFIIKIIRK